MRPEVIDLDAQATSPLLPEALAAMLPWLEKQHWNPHSAHRGGRMAKAAIEVARMQLAQLIQADTADVIFTSGATESNNLALKGVMEGRKEKRLLTFVTEHSCVLQSARHLQQQGHMVEFLPVDAQGLPDMEAYRSALATGDVALVSAMWINNEIGSIWPIADMAAMAHDHGALFHSDAAQALGKVELVASKVDLLSMSGHKIGGPKGVGALYIRKGLKPVPQMDGGGQEADVRSGTLSPALVVGFGAAATVQNPQATRDAVSRLMQAAIAKLAAVDHRINGPDPTGEQRWPGNLSVTFPGVESSRIMSALPGLALSTGSACSAQSGRLSHVLGAIGLEDAAIRQTLRIGWNRHMRPEQLQQALDQLITTVQKLQTGFA